MDAFETISRNARRRPVSQSVRQTGKRLGETVADITLTLPPSHITYRQNGERPRKLLPELFLSTSSIVTTSSSSTEEHSSHRPTLQIQQSTDIPNVLAHNRPNQRHRTILSSVRLGSCSISDAIITLSIGSQLDLYSVKSARMGSDKRRSKHFYNGERQHSSV